MSTTSNPHRIEVELRTPGDVTARMVCDAPVNSPCRLHCGICEEYLQAEHDSHELSDMGYCLKIEGWFDDEVLANYAGKPTTLRPDPALITWNGAWTAGSDEPEVPRARILT